MLRGIGVRRRRGRQRMRWLDGITDSIDVSLSEFQELVRDRDAWRAAIHGFTKSQTQLSDWTELNWTEHQKKMSFHHRGLECKSRKLRDTWSNRQVWPWSTKWSRKKAKRLLLREHTGHTKHPLPTTQEMTLHMDITRWSIPKIKLIIFFVAKDDEALYSQQKQNQEQTVAQIINLLQDSNLNWRMYGKPLGHLGMT